jgi:hypothetical protein
VLFAIFNLGPEELIFLLILGATVAGMWATFQKAGKPGWAALVPIYNVVVGL